MSIALSYGWTGLLIMLDCLGLAFTMHWGGIRNGKVDIRAITARSLIRTDEQFDVAG